MALRTAKIKVRQADGSYKTITTTYDDSNESLAKKIGQKDSSFSINPNEGNGTASSKTINPPIVKTHTQQYNLNGTKKIPTTVSITNNNILNTGAKNIINKNLQEDISETIVTGVPKNTQIDLSGKQTQKTSKVVLDDGRPKYTKTVEKTVGATTANSAKILAKNMLNPFENVAKAGINKALGTPSVGSYLMAGNSIGDYIEDAINGKDEIKYTYGEKIAKGKQNTIKQQQEINKGLLMAGRPDLMRKAPELTNQDKVNLASSKVKEVQGADESQKRWEIFNKARRENIAKDWTGEYVEDIYKKAFGDDIREKSYIDDDSFGGKVIAGTGQALSQFLLSFATAGAGNELGVTSGVGRKALELAPVGVSAYGGGLSEAYNYTDDETKAQTYALGTATVEVLTELITGSIPGLGEKSGIDYIVDDKLINKISNRATRELVRFGYRVNGEGFEEGLANILDTYIKQKTIDPNAKVDINAIIEDHLIGMISAGVLEVPTNIQSTRQAVREQHEKTNLKKDITTENAEARVNELIEKGYNEETALELVNEALKETKQNEVQYVEQQIKQNNTTNTPVSNETQQDNTINQNQQNSSNKLTKKEIKTIAEEVNNQQEKKLSQTVEMSKNKNELKAPIVNDFINSAKQSNFNVDSEEIKSVNSILSKRNIEGKFDSTQFKNDSEAALWTVDGNGKRSVIFNPNANEKTIFQNVVVHELTHDLLSSKNSAKVLDQQDILDYVSKTPGYDIARKSLEEAYSRVYDKNSPEFKQLVDEEVVASVLGSKLGNQEFINRLNGQKPNLAKRIYNWVVNKIDSLNKMVGHQNEKAYWRNVANRFEKAFNMENKKTSNKVDTKLALSKNALSEVSSVATETKEQAKKNQNQFVKLKDNTIKSLVDYGIEDLPMLSRRGHVRENILTEEQAKKLGYSVKNKHFHGLGVKTYLEIIDSMDNPVAVYQYTGKEKYDINNFIILTPIEIDGKKAIVPIEIHNNPGQYNNVSIDYNKIKTAYFKENVNYINDMLEKGIIKEIFAGSNSQKTSLTANNISQSNKNVKSDISTKYSIQENQNNTQDNQGRTLSKQQQEYFKDSKARDKKGNLITVYHTTTDKTVQFNKFDPTGTDYYKFGNQIVNYFTDDKEMSGSYADQYYEMADTKKITSVQEANEYLKKYNDSFNTEYNPTGNANYVIKEEKGKYNIYNDVEEEIINSAKNFIDTLNKEEKDFIKKYIQDGASKELFKDRYGITSEQENYIKKYENWAFNQYSPKSLSHAPQNYLAMLLMNTYNHIPVASYNNENDMFKNLKHDLQQENYENRKKYQYEGYVNITNPYTIDAEGRTWNKIESKGDTKLTKELLKVNSEDRQYLERLASDSIKTYNDNLFNYQQAERAINDFAVDRTNNTLEQRLIHRTIHDLGFEDFMKVLNGEDVYWGRKEQFMDDAFNNGFSTYKQKQEFDRTGNIPVDVLNKVNEIIHEPTKYQDRYLKKELDVLGIEPEIKTTTVYNLWKNQQDSYKKFDEGGRYEYSKFNNQVNEKNLYRTIDSEILFKLAKKGFNDNNIRLLYNDWSVTNDIVKQIIELNKFGENYDGVIMKNVIDYGGDSEKHTPHDLYITFGSNQFKAVDNTNPTTDDDIRYSKKTGKWQEFVENNFKSDGTKTTFKDIKIPMAEDLKNKVIRDKVKTKKNNNGLKSARVSAKIAQNKMDLSNNEKNEFRKELMKYKGYTKEKLTNARTYNEIKDIVKKYADREITYANNEINEIKDYIRKTKLEVTQELKNNITDYNEFRKSNFGKLKLSNEGMSIDSLYEELSETYPGYFSNEIDTEEDRLYAISDFMNEDSTITEKYSLDDRTIDDITAKVFNTLQNNAFSEEQIEGFKKEISDRMSKITRKSVREMLQKQMRITAEDLSVGKDIKSLNYQMTDPIRVNEKVFGRELGDKINNETIRKTTKNEAAKTRWLNSERNDIKELGIKARSKESAAVQKYGEKKYLNKYGELVEYGDKELSAEFPNVKTQDKIKRAAEVIRNKYDKYIDQINETLTSLGYDAIPKRADYMRHFQELGDIFSRTGVPFNLNDMRAEDLPTDINGLTEFNKPGKNYFASAQRRIGEKTVYDAITGIDGYLEGAGNLIYHTADIQRYRALSSLIRDSFGTKGFDNLGDLTDAQAEQRVNDILDNKLSRYAAWLDEQANHLAGKKGAIDRGVERFLGRRVYTGLNTMKKQVGSNMTGFNARSALTNLISSTIAAGKTNKIAFAKGTASTIRNMFKNDGFIEKSDFLTNRFGSDQLSQKTWQKLSNAGQIFMTGTDYFTANQITRSKYYEGLQKGMSESEAIKYADDFASRVMGDRSLGMTAEAFNSKTLGLLTQFQLEVNNQWQYMIHDTIMDYQKNSKINGGLKAGATALFQMGQIAAFSYFFNEIFEKLTGSRAAFDPIDILKKLFGSDDDEDKSWDKRISKAGEELIDAIPFGNIFTGGGRIPISEAFKGIETLGKKVTNQKNQYGGEISWEDVGTDVLGSLPYYVLPTGYSQAKKTTKGLGMFSKDKEIKGSYTKSGRLRFPVKDTLANRVQAGLFGEYSSSEARKYFDQNRSALTENQQRMYNALKIPISDYWNINKEINSIKKELKGTDTPTEERKEKYFEYIDSLDISNIKKSILKKSLYKTYYDDDYEIEEYINSSNMSKQSKKELLEKLGLDK